MIYGLLLQHIELVNPFEPIRAELRPSALDGRNHCLNGYRASGVNRLDGIRGVSGVGGIAPLN